MIVRFHVIERKSKFFVHGWTIGYRSSRPLHNFTCTISRAEEPASVRCGHSSGTSRRTGLGGHHENASPARSDRRALCRVLVCYSRFLTPPRGPKGASKRRSKGQRA